MEHTKRLPLLPLFIFLLCSSSLAQNLDDFRSAAAADGVKLIPFRDIRSAAGTIADEVQRRKDQAQNFNYDVFVSQKDNILREIKQTKQEIENVKREKSEWLNKNPGANASSFDEQINKKERGISDNGNKLNEMNAKLKNAAEVFGILANSRFLLREQFDKALRELPNAKSSPSKYLGNNFSEDDRKKFENYLSVIKDQIESQVSEHRRQEDGAKGRKEQYDVLMRKTEI